MKSTFFTNSLRALGLTALLLTGQSCKDILDEKIISSIGNDYINTPKGFEDAVRAAYVPLRSFYGTQQGLTMTEFGTDIYGTGSDGSYKGFHFYDSQLNSSVDILQGVWDELYRGINTCNAVIERAPTASVSDAVKKLRVAEAKFLRAHYYFILTQQWGGVDLRLTETLAPTKKVTRSTEADMYKAIVSDLESAVPDLDPKIRATEYGRVTKAAAEHLLARVYLTKATSSAKASDDYAKAATYAQSVIANYGFRLLSDFASVFVQGAGEINDEVIFAVQYTSDPLTNASTAPLANTGGNTGGNTLHLFFGMQYDVQAGMVRDINYGRPFRRLRPTTYLLETVFKDRTNDSRYRKTYQNTWLSNSPGTYNTSFDKSKDKVTYKLGDTAIFIPGYEMPLAERAKKPYQVLVPSAYSQVLFPPLQKFFDPLRPDRTYESGSRDYLAFRLAETYLILAEAQLKQGKTSDAVTAINMVRRRAAFSGKESAMEITAAQMDMNMIYEERARELAGEQTRWFDLKRWGNLVERVKAYNPDGATNVKDIHNLRPVPQAQIDRAEKNADGTSGFTQNPGF
ncbi:RagB/SusD family nutrient uptake outer membrane protein [Spirosoma rhododendri]|uniref:RagB/SusD family nutrient uptake outer membrane protein n=1 Tax=Spirosoma rhododendri TaxID=2728024 RepID=A0A7L5DKE3_9BACT|nr:RagB/SusD family nutrient uptake outer membrane protein [Spirosoma rhododendri]QJD78944.1 RagB/SusD family nutrient uptake outer membrane protein [Spirosoma rhododendri]